MADSFGYIMDVDLPEKPWIHFDHFNMPQLQGGNAEWVETPIPRRSEPHQTYVQTSAIIWAITGKIVASLGVGDERRGVDVERDLAFLRSLNYPDYGTEGEEYFKQPHRARVTLAGVLDQIGIFKDLSIQYEHVFDIAQKPMVVEVSFNLVVVSNSPPSYRDIRYAGGITWGEEEIIG